MLAEVWRFHTRRGALLRLTPFLAVLLIIAAVPVRPVSAVEREKSPVLVDGTQLPDFTGRMIGRLGLFRYDPGSGSFVPIPFQMDERVNHVFNLGGELAEEFSQVIYDVFREDDGRIDPLDELAFMFKDAGEQAPPGTPWPAAAETVGYEIHIMDPRPTAPSPNRWVYLFRGLGLPASGTSYVAWNGQPLSPVTTAEMEIEYSGMWLLTGYRKMLCGSGLDLIDRLKARAGLLPEQGETEEVWEGTSIYLGGLFGPVRAIRYVRGAGSGTNTIHHDRIYESLWTRDFKLRVHPVNAVWHYLDWLPITGLTLYTGIQRAGMAQDGVPDGPIYSPLDDWHLMRSQEGGLSFHYDFPPSTFYSSVENYLRDDSTFDDDPGVPPNYGDEDNSAYGNHGFRMNDLLGSGVDEIDIHLWFWALCANEGDASLGDAYQELHDIPLQTQATLIGEEEGPMTTLRVAVDFGDVVLDWLPTVNATSYRVYASDSASAKKGTWTLLGETLTTDYRDVGGASAPDRHYNVTAVAPTPPEMVDLSLTKTVDNPTPTIGTDVVFSVTVSNAPGIVPATELEITDLLPSGYTYVSDDSASTGTTYDPVTGIWSAGTLPPLGVRTLNITATALGAGNWLNEAEVTSANEPDVNDVYADGAGGEYDSASTNPQ